MNQRLLKRIILIIYSCLGFGLSGEENRLNYSNYISKMSGGVLVTQNPYFDCTKQDICQVPFRSDFYEYLDMKYNHKRKIVYKMDQTSYYYLAYNPATGKHNAFDLKIRFYFNPISTSNNIFEIGIDTQTQSGQLYSTSPSAGKPNWKYLFAETPTLNPVVSENQVFVATDHPIDGGRLNCINAKTGKLEWFFLTPGAILMYPILFGKYIIILDDSGNLYWIDKEFGDMRYKYVMEEFPVGYPILKENIVYFANRRGNFYAINLNDATTVWKDLALIGDVLKMQPDKRGILLLANQSYWLFSYANGNKQGKIDFR